MNKKLYTIEDLQKLDYNMWIHCTTAEQMAKLGKYYYYYGPKSLDKGIRGWIDMKSHLERHGNSAGVYIGRENIVGGWNPWTTVLRDTTNYIEFNQVIFPEMKKQKIIGYKLIKEYPGSKKLGETVKADHVTRGDYEKYPEFWEPIYEKESKEFIIHHSEGTLTLTVNKENIDTREGIFGRLNIEEIRSILVPRQVDAWVIKPSHINIGCKLEIPVKELKEVLTYYDELNK